MKIWTCILCIPLLSTLFIGCAATGPIYPTITNHIASRDLHKYRQIAVLPFADAPSAPQSGQIAQGLAIQTFSKSGFNVMERGRLDYVLNEQKLSLSGLIDTVHAIKMGKLLGVTAVVVGEVGQYSVRQRHTDTTNFQIPISGQTFNIPIQGKQWEEAFVSISLRVIDVETSQLIYSGSGQYIIAGWVRNPSQPQQTNGAQNNSPTVPGTKDNSVINMGFQNEAIAWTEKSNESIKSKNWSEVIRTTSVAIKIDPSYPAAYVNRSWGYLEKGFFDEALADCQTAIDLDKRNAPAFNNRGLLYLKAGKSAMAKADFEVACNEGLEVGCSNIKLITGYTPIEKVDFFLKKAEEAFNRKDWDNVIKYASEISQSDIALSVRAGAYAHKGMFAEAFNDCDAAIKINPNSALAYNNKGFALELSGKKREASLNYEFACNLQMTLGCTNMNRVISIK
jgi:Tfp pilus assembly protein PilF